MKTNLLNVLAYLLETLLLLTLGIGVTYTAIYLAGQWNLPVSKNLIENGRWCFYSWRDFPVLDCIGMFLGMTALPIIWERYRKTKPREIGFFLPPRWSIYFVFVLVAAGAFTLISRGTVFFENMQLSLSQIIFFALYFCCVSVTEETMFRGILQRRIRHISNSPVAILISTITFVLWHHIPDSSRELLLRIFGALLLAIFYDRSRSLYPTILLHWLINIGQI